MLFIVCALLSVAPFPPTDTSARQWGTLFTQRKTFGLYVGHLGNPCQLLDIGVGWNDDTVRAIGRGIANKPAKTPRFHKSLTPALLGRLIRTESCESQLAGL